MVVGVCESVCVWVDVYMCECVCVNVCALVNLSSLGSRDFSSLISFCSKDFSSSSILNFKSCQNLFSISKSSIQEIDVLDIKQSKIPLAFTFKRKVQPI